MPQDEQNYASIAAAWEDFKKHGIPDRMPASVVETMRSVFYAGAMGCISVVATAAADGDCDKVFAALEAANTEIGTKEGLAGPEH